MARQLSRTEETPVLIYKGPATAYVEDIMQVARKNGYRLIDSRCIRKSFLSKMKELESVVGRKLMFIEGQDVNLLTPKAKEIKVIPKSREDRVIETSESIAKAVEAMTLIASKFAPQEVVQEVVQEKPKAGRPPKE